MEAQPKRHLDDGQQFDRPLMRQTARSVGWTIMQAAGDQLFSFFVFVLMAHLLTKRELGTFALAFIFMEIGREIASAGITQRIARAKSLSDSQLDTIFWTNMLSAVLYCGLIVGSAGLVERVFGAPELGRILPWMTIPVLLNALGNTHLALRLRDFGHRTLAVRSFAAGLLGGVCAAGAALAGAGIWALVLQRIIREGVGTILAWRTCRWRPKATFDIPQAKTNLSVGTNLAVADLVALFTVRVQDLMIGRYIGATALSTYRVAWRCTDLIGPGIVAPFSTVGLQTFSRLQDHPDELRSAYCTLLRHCGLLSIPALIGYGLAGPWLVPALFGSQWTDAGWIAPALMPLAIPFTISLFVLALLSSLGHVAWQRQVAIVELASTIVVTVFAVAHGLTWVALAYVARSYLILPLQLHLVKRASGITFSDHAAALWPPLVAAFAMSAVIGPILYLADPHNLLLIVLICAGGALTYCGSALVLMPRERAHIAASLANRLRAA